MRRLFTSESVTEGHPDKLCDQVSDAILDAIIKQDPMARVACETFTTTGIVTVMGEITTSAYVEIPDIVRQVVKVSQATRAMGSCLIIASRIASLTWSQSLSGCPSVTDSEVKSLRI